VDRLIYISPDYSTFVKKDINFLSKKYSIAYHNHTWNNKLLLPISLLLQLAFLIKNIIYSKAIFVMFGGYWSILPAIFGKLFRKPVYIILGGTDCVSFPSINYGSLRKPVLKKVIEWSYKLSTRLLPVDESLVYSENLYFSAEYKMQGFKYYFPTLKTPFQVIHNGFDHTIFVSDINKKRKNSFVTVAQSSDLRRIQIKGIDKILELANIFTECSFSIIGISLDLINKLGTVPSNIRIYEFMPFEMFKRHLEESEFYLQLSISEGFPNALCEAMLCHCIPIGSEVGAIPTIIGDTGFIVQHSETSYIAEVLKSIIVLNDEKRNILANNAKNRIIENFSLSKRQESFLNMLKKDLN
jgi:glycosyltransferase involved in cell wall biosynthesis